MKKYAILFFTMLMCFCVQAQTIENASVKNEKRFEIGLSWLYMNLDMKVHDLSLSSVWQGVDFGTDDLTAEEIDEINSIAERTTTLNGIMLEGGATLFGKPGSKWSADGSVMLGIAGSFTKTYNLKKDTNEMEVSSHLTEPCFGIGFSVIHHFNQTWGLLLKPLAIVTFGQSDEITDNMYPVVENFTESRKDKFVTAYGRLNILATYTVGKFRIAAGPGLYYAGSHHEYKVERTNNTTGDVLLDQISTSLVPRAFIDGVAALEWTFMDPLSLNVFVGAGRDITARAGLYYRF